MTETRSIPESDWARFESHVGEILTAFGMDLSDPGTRNTPRRWLEALRESTSGYEGDPNVLTTFPTEYAKAAEPSGNQIIEGPIGFHALCEHHALPFFGTAYVGYLAGAEIIGISKLTRLVRIFSRRFTVQERLGRQIAETLSEYVEPHGVAVRLEAAHLCTRLRGVREEQSRTVTTFWSGAYEKDPVLRQEFRADLRTQEAS